MLHRTIGQSGYLIKCYTVIPLTTDLKLHWSKQYLLFQTVRMYFSLLLLRALKIITRMTSLSSTTPSLMWTPASRGGIRLPTSLRVLMPAITSSWLQSIRMMDLHHISMTLMLSSECLISTLWWHSTITIIILEMRTTAVVHRPLCHVRRADGVGGHDQYWQNLWYNWPPQPVLRPAHEARTGVKCNISTDYTLTSSQGCSSY